MLVVEGPDGAGKTHLIGALSKLYPQFRIPRYEEDRNELHSKNVRGRVWSSLGKEIYCRDAPEIHDRLYLSELVYGPIIRGGDPQFSPYEMNLIAQTFRLYQFPVILCLPPLEVVRANVAKGDQMPGVVENIDAIWKRYLGLVTGGEMYGWNFEMYDYREATQSDHFWDRIIRTVDKHLIARKARQSWK